MNLRCGAVWVFCLSVLASGAALGAASSSPSNDRVNRRVDEIIREPKYDWLREGGSGSAPVQPPSTPLRGKGKGGAAGTDASESSDGCAFDPNFQDWPPPERDDGDEGCGNSEPMDCDCAPDLGNCACEPVIGNCGSCVPGTSTIIPMGYVLGGLALGLIVFFLVRALIRQLPEDNAVLEDADEEISTDEIRMSRVHQWDSSTLLDRARSAAADADYKSAVGYVYLLAISVLSKNGYIALERSTTNWHIVQQTRKNGGPVSAVHVVIRHFEDLFFGSRPATKERFDDCLHQVEANLLTLGEGNEYGQ